MLHILTPAAHACGRRYQILTRAYHLLLIWLALDLVLRWSPAVGAPMAIRDAARVAGTLVLVVLVIGEAVVQLREHHATVPRR